MSACQFSSADFKIDFPFGTSDSINHLLSTWRRTTIRKPLIFIRTAINYSKLFRCVELIWSTKLLGEIFRSCWKGFYFRCYDVHCYEKWHEDVTIFGVCLRPVSSGELHEMEVGKVFGLWDADGGVWGQRVRGWKGISIFRFGRWNISELLSTNFLITSTFFWVNWDYSSFLWLSFLNKPLAKVFSLGVAECSTDLISS